MFVETIPGSFLNFSSCLVVQAHMGFISGGLGCGSNFTGDSVKIGSKNAAKAVLSELMTRYNEGRRVVFYQEFEKLCTEMLSIFPYTGTPEE